MVNSLHDPARESFLRGEISFNVGTIRVLMLSGYTQSLAHQFVDDLTGAGGATIEATSDALTGKTTTDGTADADDELILAVGPGDPVDAVALVQSSAPAGGADLATSAQRIIATWDDDDDLPFSINGSDVLIEWSALGLFTLGGSPETS